MASYSNPNGSGNSLSSFIESPNYEYPTDKQYSVYAAIYPDGSIGASYLYPLVQDKTSTSSVTPSNSSVSSDSTDTGGGVKLLPPYDAQPTIKSPSIIRHSAHEHIPVFTQRPPLVSQTVQCTGCGEYYYSRIKHTCYNENFEELAEILARVSDQQEIGDETTNRLWGLQDQRYMQGGQGKVCYKCGEVGHLQRDCLMFHQQAQTTCFTCGGSLGHLHGCAALMGDVYESPAQNRIQK
ncbi:hypothetical protein B0O99DRAFT_680589 [Bisporella sp. PMI_857]|nr:hypothetical protein B0O99DRAFT_680589 [Bisporella sp. PMI_857]